MVSVGWIETDEETGISKFIVDGNALKMILGRQNIGVRKDKYVGPIAGDWEDFMPDIVVVDGKRYNIIDYASHTDGSESEVMIRETNWEGK